MFAFELDEEITLRLLKNTDAKELFQLIDYSRDHLREWLAWIDGTQTVKDSEQFIKGTLKQYEEKLGLTLGIYFNEELTGLIGYNTIDWTNRIGIIGYWLGSSFQGEGIMTRSVTGLIDYGFHQLGLNRIEIRAAVENRKSRSIPERLGFLQEGLARQGEWLYDHYVDLVIYGLLASEWESERRSR